MHVVLAAGGTAGHIEPALSLADALRRRDANVGITVVGTATGMENTLVPARGYTVRHVPRLPLPRKPSPDLLKLPGRMAGAVKTAKALLDEIKPDAVVGFGGYVCVPMYLAARSRKVPIVVHEGNTPAGLANRIGARFTEFVATTGKADDLPHGRLIGMPLRHQIATLDRAALRAEARAHFGLDPNAPTLLVFGGSLGARSLNAAVSAAAPALRAAGIGVLHSVGRDNFDEAAAAAGRAGDGPAYVVVPYLERMDLAYAAADLALCRSGAMTCAELSAVGLPAWYVPLPIGNGEQRRNALPIVEAGGGGLLDDKDLSASWIESTLIPLLRDDARIAAMSKAAAAHGRPGADQALVELLDAAMAAKAKA